MISVAEALELVQNCTEAAPITEIALADAYGLALAKNVISPMHMPPFRQSSMDGYALALTLDNTYTLVGEIQAGEANRIHLQPGEAVRIFTGARVPDAADTVVMQEHVFKAKNSIQLEQRPEQFANVRPAGEQIKQGDIALNKGTFLNAAAVGFLSGLGLQKIPVHSAPRVSILVTGDELAEPGEILLEGQVYNSNGVTLELALRQIGIRHIEIEKIKDTREATTQSIKKHLKYADMILISGGISVGDYDFVREALLENSVDEKFYKVNQKPGKPLWFGKKGAQMVFALPGNPASSLTCFYVYVIPALYKSMGFEQTALPRKRTVIAENFQNKFGKDLFLKAEIKEGKAYILSGQASSMLRSFAVCNALVHIPATTGALSAGDKVNYLELPNKH